MGTKIEWCDETWNPIVGCTKCSPGCAHCYAETMATRLQAMALGKTPYRGVVEDGHWTGHIGALDATDDGWLRPCRWKKPRRIFVNSMGDLFHEAVDAEQINRVLAVAALCRRHTFLLLTKRPERMAEHLSRFDTKGWADQLSDIAYALTSNDDADCYVANAINGVLGEGYNVGWPLCNVWCGTTVENQAMADARIPHLLNTPAAVRFVSCEPLLGPIALGCDGPELGWVNYLQPPRVNGEQMPGIDWVIAGCETGPGRRPAPAEWFRYLAYQCREADVPFFLKQQEDANGHIIKAPVFDGRQWLDLPEVGR